MSIFSHISKATPQEWMRDLIPRFLVIIAIIAVAWAAVSMQANESEDEWLNTLEKNSLDNAKILNNFFNDKITMARNLAEDNRIVAFIEGNKDDSALKRSVRRSIYEFQYNNEIDNAYIYDASRSVIITQTRGAITLPETNLTPFYKAVKGNIQFVQNIIKIEDKDYFLFAHAINNNLGGVSGYAIYLEDLSKTLSSMNILSKKTQHVTYMLSRLISNNEAFVIKNFLRLAPVLSTETNSSLNVPIFKQKNFLGLYQESASDVMVGAIRFLSNYESWSVTSSVPQAYLSDAETESLSVAIFASFILSLIAMIIPLKGPYSSHLRAIYFMIGLGKNLSGLSKSELKRLQTESQEDDNSSDIDWGNAGGNTPSKPQPAKKPMPLAERKPSQSEIAYAIRTGMKKRSIKLLYQPIVDALEDKVISNEVFLQIIDETGAVLPPTLWLPVAEREHLFQLIDETVVKVAVDKHYDSDSIATMPLSFNISGDAFASFDFMKDLMGDNAVGKRMANNTIFELRSREMLSDKRAFEFIRECRAGGFRFASDYLGGDEAVVEATKKLKFDFLKIDITRFNMKDKESLTKLVKIIQKAKKVKLDIIIEKVEDEQTVLILKKLGIRYMQGYYFGKPDASVSQN